MKKEKEPLSLVVRKVLEYENRRKILLLIKVIILSGIVYVQSFHPELLKTLKLTQIYINAILFYLGFNILISIGRTLTVSYFIRKRRSGKLSYNFVIGINTIASLVKIVILLLSIGMLFDISLQGFFTSISIFAAAIAILSKDYVSNMINGMIIMFSDQISINDFVEVGAFKGKIINITLTNIHLLNEDDDIIYIPNNIVLTTNVINYTKRPIRKISLDLEVSLNAVKDVDALEEFLIKKLHVFKNEIEDNSFTLKVKEIKKDSIWLKFQYLLKKPNRDLEKDIKKLTVRSVVKYIGEELKSANNAI